MLADRMDSDKESQKSIDKSIKYPTLAQYKSDFPFLKEVASFALANANFFCNKSVGFSTFKNKKDKN